jgi:hypothetical protein
MSWADRERGLQDRITSLIAEKEAAVDDLAGALIMVRKLRTENAWLREVAMAADLLSLAGNPRNDDMTCWYCSEKGIHHPNCELQQLRNKLAAREDSDE